MSATCFEEGRGESVRHSFSDKSIRMAFVRKVYGILCVQLLITSGLVCLFIFCEPVSQWVIQHPWLFWVAVITAVVFQVVLVCYVTCRRSFPCNYICLFLFTLAEGFMLGVISCQYNTKTILLAVVITAIITLALTLFAFQTKLDFTMCYGIAFVLFIVLFIFSIVLVFWQDRIATLVYCFLGVLVFSLFLVIDTQMIIGGTHKLQFSPEDYVFASLCLYTDIILLFQMILHISSYR